MGKGELLSKKNVSKFRDIAGLAPSEPLNLHALLLKLNVQTIFRPLTDSFSGMAIKIKDFRFILVNSNHPIGRQNFTIGHELYHLYIQESFKPHRCETAHFDSKKDKDEYLADVFSANLLMPEDGILELIPDDEMGPNKIKIPSLLKLEQIFGVSHSALLFRLKNIGLIDKSFLEENRNEIMKRAKFYGFDTRLYLPGNENLYLGDLGTVSYQLFEDEKISEGHFLELIQSIGGCEEE
jgi:Zn-dependent peptidase ImmA (M78 family)